MLSLQGAEGPPSFSFPSLLNWEGSARAAQWEGNGTTALSNLRLGYREAWGVSMTDGALDPWEPGCEGPLTLVSQAVRGP